MYSRASQGDGGVRCRDPGEPDQRSLVWQIAWSLTSTNCWAQWRAIETRRYLLAGPWLFLRAAHLYQVRHLPVFIGVFVAIAASTVMIRIHYLVNIVQRNQIEAAGWTLVAVAEGICNLMCREL